MMKKVRGVRLRFELLVTVILVALLLRFFVIEVYRVPDSFYAPRLQAGDHVLVLKSLYGLKIGPLETQGASPVAGRFYIFADPNSTSAIKPNSGHFLGRVLAQSGDRVECREGKLYINEVENSDGCVDGFTGLIVPPEQVFIESHEKDGPVSWGAVPRSFLVGRVLLILYSELMIEGQNRWHRVLRMVN